jgi:hypothetical protein
MKSIAAGSVSSCLIWFLVFGVVSLCLCPMAIFIGGFSSTLQANFFVARILGFKLAWLTAVYDIISRVYLLA